MVINLLYLIVMFHIVCLTKSYNWDDLYTWFKYHDIMGYYIHLIDNDSDSEISFKIKNIIINTRHTYEKIEGWPNQWQLFNNILNNNKYDINNNDFITFIDDDEYIWYKSDNEKIEQYINKQLSSFNYNSFLVPEILMSTHELINNRTKNYIYTHLYRRNDFATQGKAIIKYNTKYEYDFSIKSGDELGHVPVIYSSTENLDKKRYSIVNNSGISNTTYGITAYSSNLRFYHYHIKSLIDWDKKIKRGSAALNYQWYNADITKNKYYNKYDIMDYTMLETLKQLNI